MSGTAAAPASSWSPNAAGAWLRWSWEPRDRHRVVTGLGAVGALAAVGLAVFGLPSLDLHGPLHHLGIMDPLCGGTRAAAYTLRGEWMQAWRYNPMGILAVVGSGAAVLRAVVGVLTGRWLTATLVWTAGRVRVSAVVLTVLIAALEVRQQLQAELLLAGT